MQKRLLKSGVAVLALMGLSLGLSAHAGDTKPASKPLGAQFTTASHDTAARTVAMVRNGTPGPSAPQGTVIERELAKVTPDDVVACPDDGTTSANWQEVPEDLRKIAKPGQCFARLLMAPQFQMANQRTLVAEARTESHTVPEVAEWVMQDVMVQPEHVMRKVLPAVTHVVTETQVITPAGFRDEVTPARYETRIEHVLVQPERQVWTQKAGIATGAALVTPGDHLPVRYRADGTLTWPGKAPVSIQASDDTAQYLQKGSAQTVYCLQVLPAVYEDRRSQVVVEPEHVRHIEIPAVTRQVQRTVIDVPEHEEEYTIPAVYQKQKAKRIITPAHTETVDIPAVYQNVTTQQVVSEAQPVWREVLCDKNASPELVSQIQRELNKRGYGAGPVDGQLGTSTVAAMQRFQADKGLAQGQVSVESVKALGIGL